MSRLLVGMVAVALGSLLGSDAFGARSTVQPFNGRIAFAAVRGIASMKPGGRGANVYAGPSRATAAPKAEGRSWMLAGGVTWPDTLQGQEEEPSTQFVGDSKI